MLDPVIAEQTPPGLFLKIVKKGLGTLTRAWEHICIFATRATTAMLLSMSISFLYFSLKLLIKSANTGAENRFGWP